MRGLHAAIEDGNAMLFSRGAVEEDMEPQLCLMLLHKPPPLPFLKVSCYGLVHKVSGNPDRATFSY